MRDLPVFPDLRAFLSYLEGAGDLARLAAPVETRHEMTAVLLRALQDSGPALRFDAATVAGRAAAMPVIGNLFGTRERVAAGLGVAPDRVGDLGAFLAALRAPAPVAGMRDALSRWPMLRAALNTNARVLRRAPAQRARLPDLGAIPVQVPWPGDAGPLITWPVVVTRPADGAPALRPRVGDGVPDHPSVRPRCDRRRPDAPAAR